MTVRYQRAVDLVELTGILQTTVTGLSIDEVATRFEVSRRTAERMLGALRERFPDLAPIYRGGRKYWRLPGASHSRPIQLPRTLATLSERIVQLEAEASASRSASEDLRGIADSILESSHVGMIVLDSKLRAVWTNEAFLNYLGLDRSDVVSRDMRDVIQETLQHVFEEPVDFASQLLATYDDDSYIANLECRIPARGDRPECWLEHWSRPITRGRFAGGRIDHYVEITKRVDEDAADSQSADARKLSHIRRYRGDAPANESAPVRSTTPILREHLAILTEAADQALLADALSTAVASRLSEVLRSQHDAIKRNIDIAERGEIKPEPLGVAKALQAAVASLRSVADEKGIRIVVDVANGCPIILADPGLIIGGLARVGRNSIDALPSGSTIEFRAEVLADPERVRVSLLDHGPTASGSFPEVESVLMPPGTSRLGLGVCLIRDADGNPTGGIMQYFEMPVHGPLEE